MSHWHEFFSKLGFNRSVTRALLESRQAAGRSGQLYRNAVGVGSSSTGMHASPGALNQTHERRVVPEVLARIQNRFLGKGSGVVVQILECSLAPPWMWTPGPGQIHGMPRCISEEIKRFKSISEQTPASMLRWDLPVAMFKHGVWLTPDPEERARHPMSSADVCGCSGRQISTSGVGFIFDPDDGQALRLSHALPQDAFTSHASLLRRCRHLGSSEAMDAEYAQARHDMSLDAFHKSGHHCWESSRRRALQKQKAFVALKASRWMQRGHSGNACIGMRAGLHALYNQFHFRALGDRVMGNSSTAETGSARGNGNRTWFRSTVADSIVAIFYINASEYTSLRRHRNESSETLSARLIEEARAAAIRAYHTARYVQKRLAAWLNRSLPVLQARLPCIRAGAWRSPQAQQSHRADVDDFVFIAPPVDVQPARAPGLGAHRSPLAWHSRGNLTCTCRNKGQLMRQHVNSQASHVFAEQAATVASSARAGRKRDSGFGLLGTGRCLQMLREPGHVFHTMWSTSAWGVMKGVQTACWAAPRTHGGRFTTSERFFEDVLQGTHCHANWLETSNPVEAREHSQLARKMWRAANSSAAAIIGLDRDIRQRCWRRARTHHDATSASRARPYVEDCIAAHLNVLALRGTRMPYNLCRNLEWLTCAALGRLPDQHGRGRFLLATQPRDLDPAFPLGQCVGHVPKVALSRPQGFGYTARDVFAFEACALSEMCANSAELFLGRPTFSCNFSREGFERLRDAITPPATDTQLLRLDTSPCARKIVI